MRKYLSLTLFAGAIISAHAANETEIFSKPKFSGFFIGQYAATFREDANSNTFNFRALRLVASGKVLNDFEWRLQGQINGNTAKLGDSPRLLDATVEWKKYKQLKVKVGQFKRPFTFENQLNPIDQGFMSVGQVITSLAGFSDRTGEHSGNGRDIGILLNGDILHNSKGRALLHYDIGVFNGQGINVKDVDNRKDIIGGIWIAPFKGFRLGASGWIGSYARSGSWTDENGDTQSGVRSVSRYRYAISAEYKNDDWQIRSEYVHNTGGAFAATYQSSSDAKNAEYSTSLGDKADGFYALAFAPIVSHKLLAKVRYDLYRKNAEWSSAKTQYEIGLNYLINKSFEIHAEYALINDRSLAADKHNYSQVDVQFSVRF